MTDFAVQHVNPPGLLTSPAFSQAIVVSGAAKTIYIGGQDAVDATGTVVGEGDVKAQAHQIFRNLQAILYATGARLEDVVKWTIYVVSGTPIQPGVEAFQEVWGSRGEPPVISVIFVAGLGRPEFLVEIDAVAVVPNA
jgi:enamine deaminase RidA (YjgF/YER057c/UK114 family)